MDVSQYLDTGRVGYILGLSQAQLLRRIRIGEIKAEKLGKHEWFITKSEVRAYAKKIGREISAELLESTED